MLANLNVVQKGRMELAKQETIAQVEIAKALYQANFAGSQSNEILAALIQAVATNYATTCITNVR